MRRLVPICALIGALGVACEPAPETEPAPFTDLLDPARDTRQAATLFRTFLIEPPELGEGPSWTYAAAVDEVRILIDTAELQLDVMLENLDDTQIADAIAAAAERGVAVRVVGDVDRRTQAGFEALEAAGIAPIYGDGPILWNGVFGEDPIERTGEDNRMTHNVIIADRQRLISLSAGFPDDVRQRPQAGFAADSEVLARDFGNIFDQLYGEVFATTLTYYDQPVVSDTNNRTLYETEESIIELYFGPQEPLVKELIDRIYAARSAVWIATPTMLNSEIARALIYKGASGFDVRVVVGTTDGAEAEAGALPGVFADLADQRGEDLPAFRTLPALTAGGTLIVLDGQPTFDGDQKQPGVALVLSAPLFESVPYAITGVRPDGLDLEARPSDRFTDAHLWGVHGGPDDHEDYRVLRAQFERIFAAAEEVP